MIHTVSLEVAKEVPKSISSHYIWGKRGETWELTERGVTNTALDGYFTEWYPANTIEELLLEIMKLSENAWFEIKNQEFSFSENSNVWNVTLWKPEVHWGEETATGVNTSSTNLANALVIILLGLL